MSPRRKDLASLVVHEAEPGVGSIRRTEVVADALPGLIPLLFHEQPEATRLKLGAVALNELLPRARLHAALVLWLAPVLAAALRSLYSCPLATDTTSQLKIVGNQHSTAT